MINVENLEISLKGFKRKYNNIIINEGEIVMITGENGSGKTILLNAICGLVDYKKGSIKIKNRNNNLELWKEYTSVFIDRNFLIPYLKPSEYFDIVLSLSDISRDEGLNLIELYSEKLHFTEFEKQIKSLSIGNQKKVGIISTLINAPKLVLWDEPFANLDEKTCNNLNLIIEELSRSKTTVLYTNHPSKKTFRDKIYEIDNE